MTFKIKTIKKLQNLPDEQEMMESMARLGREARDKARRLWMLGGGGALLLLLVIGFYLMNFQAEQTAEDNLQRATDLYMNRPLTDTDASLSHVRQAVELLQVVVNDYYETRSAPLALHLLGNALDVLGDHDGAIKTYQSFLRDFPAQSSLNSLVRQRLAYAYLEQGNLEKAERTFEGILTIAKAPNKDLALLELASLGEQQNQVQAALARYQELIKGYPHSIYLGEASSKVRILGGGDGGSGESSQDSNETK